MSNWLYVLQRWTGIIAFFFIGWHVWIERFATGGMSTYADVSEGMRILYYLAFYVIGISRRLSISATASGISPASGASR